MNFCELLLNFEYAVKFVNIISFNWRFFWHRKIYSLKFRSIFSLFIIIFIMYSNLKYDMNFTNFFRDLDVKFIVPAVKNVPSPVPPYHGHLWRVRLQLSSVKIQKLRKNVNPRLNVYFFCFLVGKKNLHW